MDICYQLHKLARIESRKTKWLMIVGVMAFSHLLFQSMLLPYENAIKSLLPIRENSEQVSSYQLSSTKAMVVRNPLTINASDAIGASGIIEEENNDEYITARDLEGGAGLEEEDRNIVDFFDGDGSRTKNFVDKNQILTTDSDQNPNKNSNVKLPKNGDGIIVQSITPRQEQATPAKDIHKQVQSVTPNKSSLFKNVTSLKDAFQGDFTLPRNNSAKKMRCELPPQSVTYIEEMNRILKRNHRSPRAMKPRRSSPRDEEILAAKLEIERAPPALDDTELYAPVFRNVSKFKRSYELMQRILKVYIYKEGSKPVFHHHFLKGLYASEGWFMKLMEGNKQFVVKDPQKAHLFYMPFSSRMLEYTIYVRNSHNRTNLRQYLKDYTDTISAKYPFFNRTGGADHFLAACHDWAPYETRHHMERCIKALCNADVTVGFKIGRDVSLPETYIRNARNPNRNLGGIKPSQRNILAFYAGGMHGYLRPILVKHWKDKDPNMKIYGPLPAGGMNYLQHMKRSKYCICPKGYEVNSPRVIEAISYECVPVIISDNFVPPFFEVLNWDAFSIFVPEKDIPNLKDILMSIPEKRYLEMQLAVRKVQRHFLWHARPVKYDLFYMTLHSIWYNRVYQFKAR